jgi:hypothetical protein
LALSEVFRDSLRVVRRDLRTGGSRPASAAQCPPKFALGMTGLKVEQA